MKRAQLFTTAALGGSAGMLGLACLFRQSHPVEQSPSLGKLSIFPPDNPWNQSIEKASVDPASDQLIASIGKDLSLHPDFGFYYNGRHVGIPYCFTAPDTPKVPVRFEYEAASDPGPYPIPKDAPIEGGPDSNGDRHLLIIDRDNQKLYELFAAYPEPGGGYRAGSGAIYDLRSNKLRPAGWTSADAAGLPIFPGLARYEEAVEQKAIRHALRFTVKQTRRAYVSPARHFASRSRDIQLPPMGMRVRLKASYDLSGFPPSARVILQALKTYGMILADNGGNWYLSGAPDSRWNSGEINTLKRVHGSDLEVVKMGPLTTG
ncbi:MAG: hypothetical protein QM758_20275 [Armatimonas sp.]